MRVLRMSLAASIVARTDVAGGQAFAADMKEDYVRAPMPAGFQVFVNEIEGPVIANALKAQ